jgi:hypothetical protein
MAIVPDPCRVRCKFDFQATKNIHTQAFSIQAAIRTKRFPAVERKKQGNRIRADSPLLKKQ